jgi:hypothetical protein
LPSPQGMITTRRSSSHLPRISNAEEVAFLRSCQRLRGLPRLKWPGDQAPDPWRAHPRRRRWQSVLRWGSAGAHLGHGPGDSSGQPRSVTNHSAWRLMCANAADQDPARRHTVYGMQAVTLIGVGPGPRSAMGIQAVAIERCSDLAEPLCAQLAPVWELVASIPAPGCDHRQHEDPALA